MRIAKQGSLSNRFRNRSIEASGALLHHFRGHDLISRGLHRTKEFGVRIAMGARPLRLFRQLVAESLVPAAIGCALGLGLAWDGTRAIPVFIPDEYQAQIAGIARFGVALPEFLFARALVSGILVLGSVIPALRVSHARVNQPPQALGRTVA